MTDDEVVQAWIEETGAPVTVRLSEGVLSMHMDLGGRQGVSVIQPATADLRSDLFAALEDLAAKRASIQRSTEPPSP